MPSPLYDCDDPAKRVRGIGAAQRALSGGMLVVMPTDTVYGLAADAFDAAAVGALLAAKGRGRDMPVPILVGSMETLGGVAMAGEAAAELVRAFWPGGLTVVCRQQPSLHWDLGETRGTVGVRMPAHEIALELLKKTGPLAVSSANVTGQAPAATARAAREQFGDAVRVYLEAGPTAAADGSGAVASTIVDVTGEIPRVLRHGAISLDDLRDVVPETLDVDGSGPERDDARDDESGPESAPTDADDPVRLESGPGVEPGESETER